MKRGGRSTRITSYNVCYTKLLRLEVCEPVVFGPREPAAVRDLGIDPGKVSALGGKIAFESIESAVEAARLGTVDALATARNNFV